MKTFSACKKASFRKAACRQTKKTPFSGFSFAYIYVLTSKVLDLRNDFIGGNLLWLLLSLKTKNEKPCWRGQPLLQ